jgi:hypothetical protein
VSTITVTKIDAALRQLRTAIELWAADGDPVSIHTLAYSAHQIVHDLNRKAKGPHMLLDMPNIRKERQGEFVAMVKRDANFFKHADARKHKEPPSLEFTVALNDMFIMITIVGLGFLNQQLSKHEQGFLLWYRLHYPEMIEEESGRDLQSTLSIEERNAYLQLPKSEFLQAFAEIIGEKQ